LPIEAQLRRSPGAVNAHPGASDSLRNTWEPAIRRDRGYGLRVRTNNQRPSPSVPVRNATLANGACLTDVRGKRGIIDHKRKARIAGRAGL